MKAALIDQFGDIEKVNIQEISLPSLQPNEIQIRISHAGLNPVDWKILEGHLKNHIPHEFPLILGWDAAGTVTDVGTDVTSFKVGDEVYAYCRKPTVQWGTFAEFVCIEEQAVAPKPKSLSLAQAAALPLVALTAWQVLIDVAQVKSGETVLIQAGAGGVGSLAIQIAKHAGAKVITTASAKNTDYVKKMGADFVIDYTKEPIEKAIKQIVPDGLDIVFDTMGGEALLHSLSCLKKGGRLVSILEKVPSHIADKFQIHAHYVFVRPNGQELREIGQLFDLKKFIVPDIQEFSLTDIKRALEQLKAGHTRGKLVIKII